MTMMTERCTLNNPIAQTPPSQNTRMHVIPRQPPTTTTTNLLMYLRRLHLLCFRQQFLPHADRLPSRRRFPAETTTARTAAGSGPGRRTGRRSASTPQVCRHSRVHQVVVTTRREETPATGSTDCFAGKKWNVTTVRPGGTTHGIAHIPNSVTTAVTVGIWLDPVPVQGWMPQATSRRTRALRGCRWCCPRPSPI